LTIEAGNAHLFSPQPPKPEIPMLDESSPTSALPNLATAKAILQSNRAALLSSTASPTTSQISAALAIHNLIATATKQHAEWGVVRLEALYVLGTYLNRVPRLKQGRPSKNVHGGRLPSLKELGSKTAILRREPRPSPRSPRMSFAVIWKQKASRPRGACISL
jgi:hypothetical protein